MSMMKQNTAVKADDLRFEELTSRRQRAGINELLCERLGAPPGTEIPYSVCCIERRGSVYWADLLAQWEEAPLACSVKWLNTSGDVTFSQGWSLKREEPGGMRIYRGVA